MVLNGASVSAGGCYLSTAPVPYGNFTFYGYSNGQIPNGDAGWRLESAPDPKNCSVGYNYNGTGTPQVLVYTSGC
jgi:MSHA pilin protein MshA